MTFDEICSEVMDRLNLTSQDARERIEGRVNDRYRRVTSGIGLQTSRRETVTLAVDPTSDDYSELPEMVIYDLEKINKIHMVADDGGITVLKEKTYDEIVNVAAIREVPRAWAVKTMGPGEVRIVLDAYPTTTFTLHVEGYQIPQTLEGTMEPYMPTDFHDILVEGALSDELRKMEKAPLAQMAESRYQERLSDLRMFIAKSAYLDIAQGKNKPGHMWYRPWFSRTTLWN